MMRRLFVLFAMLFAWLQTAQAGGYMIGEMATRATGMASAFTAVSDDASAAWHNPAGVAFTDGAQLMGGSAVIFTSNSYASNASTKGPLGTPITTSMNAKDGVFAIPHGYFTYWDENSRLGAALSINSPFGLETDWPNTAANPFRSKATFSRINMIMVNPSIVFKITDKLSIAGGFSYTNVYQVDLNSSLQNLSGDGDGWGGTAAIFYDGDKFNFGVTYRSRVKVDLNGVATAVSGQTIAVFGGTTTAATTGITLPDTVNVGLAFMPSEQLTLSVDVDWVNWKTFDAIDIAYTSATYRGAVGAAGAAAVTGNPAHPAVAAALAAQTGKTHLPENWKATVAFRIGAEWEFRPGMRARLGYLFDPTPIQDVDFSPTIPGNDRHIFSIGFGYDMTPNLTLDLAYAYVKINTREQTASPVGAAPFSPNTVKNGTYKGDAHIPMASFNYSF